MVGGSQSVSAPARRAIQGSQPVRRFLRLHGAVSSGFGDGAEADEVFDHAGEGGEVVHLEDGGL